MKSHRSKPINLDGLRTKREPLVGCRCVFIFLPWLSMLQKKSKRKWCWKFSFELTPFDNRYGCSVVIVYVVVVATTVNRWSKKERIESFSSLSIAFRRRWSCPTFIASSFSSTKIFRFAMWIKLGHFRFSVFDSFVCTSKAKRAGGCTLALFNLWWYLFFPRLFVQPSSKRW